MIFQELFIRILVRNTPDIEVKEVSEVVEPSLDNIRSLVPFQDPVSALRN
jgi:hypothetical protein